MRKTLIALVLCVAVTGCTRYYKVTDGATGKLFFTTKVKQQKDGTVRLYDAKSKTPVTLQYGDVDRIEKDAFLRAINR